MQVYNLITADNPFYNAFELFHSVPPPPVGQATRSALRLTAIRREILKKRDRLGNLDVDGWTLQE
jgi:hypothetical protein